MELIIVVIIAIVVVAIITGIKVQNRQVSDGGYWKKFNGMPWNYFRKENWSYRVGNRWVACKDMSFNKKKKIHNNPYKELYRQRNTGPCDTYKDYTPH